MDRELLHTLPTPSAILDVHFVDRIQAVAFAAATSTGSVSIYNLNISPEQSPAIVPVETVQYGPKDVLITAFAWHPDGIELGMTLSSGQIRLGRILSNTPRGRALLSKDVTTHDLEAWTVAFLSDGSGILSGGDDCALCFTELPQHPMDCYEDLISKPEYAPWVNSSWTDKKIHGAGVTAILPVYWDEVNMLILTGSYDDHIRLIQAPTSGRRTVLAEMNLGGGVWRLKVLDRQSSQPQRPKWHPWTCDPVPDEVLLLVSCMHAGARIVRLSRAKETWQFEVLAKFEEHKSMNYGSDCQSEKNGQGQWTFITTSFYDRLLCLWRY
jgi:diphthamide biosynthesis protein 7